MTLEARMHEESWLLLPFLANGRLPATQRARVEEHVRECALCAQEAALQQLLCRSLTEPERVTWAPGPSFRKLMERIDGAPCPERADRAVARRPRLTARALSWRPPGLAWAASVVLATCFAVLAGTAYRWAQPLYATYTANVQENADVLHMAFVPSLPVGEATVLLREAGARVVEGPDASGIFGVTPAARAASPAARAAQLRELSARLRADTRVRWIAPLPAAAQEPHAGAT
jgi:hypothetical protein